MCPSISNIDLASGLLALAVYMSVILHLVFITHQIKYTEYDVP